MNYKNQLILTGKISDIGEFLATNTPESYRLGIELMAGVKIANWLKWDGNVTLSQNKIQNFTEQDIDMYDADWNPITDVNDNPITQSNYLGTTDIAYSPNVLVNSIFTFMYKGFEAGLQSSYVGKQFIDNTSDDARSLGAYFVNHLKLGYSLKNRLGLSEVSFNLAVNNLFNEHYSSNGYVWYSCYVDGLRTNDLRYFTQAGTNFMAGVSVKF
jgi:iron complex outermembrane receptor protein